MNRNVMSLFAAVGLTVGGVTLSGTAAHASAITGVGGSIYGTGGGITIDILPSNSGIDNELDFFYAWTDTGANLTDKIVIGIDNRIATINLDAVELGKELVFGISSRQGTFLSGSGARNTDNMQHSLITAAPTVTGFAESWLVSFEDLFNGGDHDYNDAIIRVNQKALTVPEPTSLALLAIGMLGLGLKRRSRL